MALTTYTTAPKTEGAAVRRLILGMQEKGWRAHAYNDGEETHVLETVSKASIASLLMETEQAWLYWRKDVGGETLKGTMMFVFGNEPHEVMADCSMDDGEWDADLTAVDFAANLEGMN